MEQCPSCRARCNGADTCRRCGTDLRLLQAVEQAAEQRLQQAITLLADGQYPAAAQVLGRSLALKRLPLAECLLAQLRCGAELPDAVGSAERGVKPYPHQDQYQDPQDWLG